MEKDKDKKDKRKSGMFSFRSKDKEKEKKYKGERPKSKLPNVSEGDVAEQDASELKSLSQKELEDIFEQLLEEMNLTEEKKAPLRKMPNEQKINMLTMQRSQSHKQHTLSAAEYIDQLNNNELKGDKKFELLSSLRVALTSNPVSWVKDFGQRAGLNSMLKNLMYSFDNKLEKRSSNECIRCLRAFSNNSYGLKQLINHDETMVILAKFLDIRDLQTMLEAVRLMAAITLVPPNGHEKVLEGITVSAELNQTPRFLPIVQGLAAEDVNLKLACMQLVNALICQVDDVDFRLHLRNEFVRTGLPDVLEELKKLELAEVKTQLDCYIGQADEDGEELVHRFDGFHQIDDSRMCFDILFKLTEKTESEPYLLSIIQHLLLIRDDVCARPLYFKLIEECITQIVLQKNGIDPDFRHTKRFDIDVEPLLNKLADESGSDGFRTSSAATKKTDSKLEEMLTAKQEAEAKAATLEAKLQQYESENSELKTKIQQGIGAVIDASLAGNAPSTDNSGIPPPPPPPPPLPGGPCAPPPPPPPPLPGGGPPPPPPPPGMGPPPPPPLPGMGPPPPPPLPGMGPPPPPPPPGMGPPCPPLGGGPPPPPFGMMAAAPAVVVAKKAKYNPDVQMKRVNWNKVNVKDIQKESFWAKVNEDSLASEDLFDGLKVNFSAKVVQKSEKNEEKKPAKKGKELKVLDGKAAQNLSILLGSVKVPYEEIKRRIIELDEEKLDVAVVEQLIRYLPEPEQMNQLAALKNEYNDLAESEQFGVLMSSIKRLVPRLNSIAFKMKFDEYVQEIKPDIVSATAALEEVKQSGKFSKILELILLIGNYMNAGSRNEQTIAFEFNFITKLLNTKTADNKRTLLHFLAETAERKIPDTMTFVDELMHVEQASRVTEDNIQKNIAQMQKALKQLEIDVKNAQQDKSAPENDKFVPVMNEFLNVAKEQCEVLEGMAKKMSTLYQEISKYFSFDPKKYTMEEFFGDIKTFADSFNQAVKDNAKIRETEEKLKRAKEAQEKRERQKEERNAQKKVLIDMNADDEQQGVMDNLLEALKTGSAFTVNRKDNRKRAPRAAGAERRAQMSRKLSQSRDLDSEAGDIEADLASPPASEKKMRHRERHPGKIPAGMLDELMAS